MACISEEKRSFREQGLDKIKHTLYCNKRRFTLYLYHCKWQQCNWVIFMVILALSSFCLEISSCLIQISVEITAAAMFLTICSGIVLQTGINIPKWSDGVHEMCRAIVFLLPCQGWAPNREALLVFVALGALVYTLHHTNVFCRRYVYVCVFC